MTNAELIEAIICIENLILQYHNSEWGIPQHLRNQINLLLEEQAKRIQS